MLGWMKVIGVSEFRHLRLRKAGRANIFSIIPIENRAQVNHLHGSDWKCHMNAIWARYIKPLHLTIIMINPISTAGIVLDVVVKLGSINILWIKIGPGIREVGRCLLLTLLLLEVLKWVVE